VRVPFEAARRTVRDTLVWRCQPRHLVVGTSKTRRRAALQDNLEEAAQAANEAANSAEHPTARVAARPFLSSAIAGGKRSEQYVSQALHAHRTEVTKKFPSTVLAKCHRTAAQRCGRSRGMRQSREPVADHADSGVLACYSAHTVPVTDSAAEVPGSLGV
jgi:hypothetical protein